MWVERDRCGWGETGVGEARQIWVEQDKCEWSETGVGGARQMWVEQDKCGWGNTNVGGARQMWVGQDRCGWSETGVGDSDGHLGRQADFKKLKSRTWPLCRRSVKMSSDPEQQYENVLQPPLKGFWTCVAFFRIRTEPLWRNSCSLSRFFCWSEWRRE